jgi:hypothetical protein
MSRYEKDFSPEMKQHYYDLLIATFLTSMLDEDDGLEEDDKMELVDKIVFSLKDHLDDEGVEYLKNAFNSFEREYYLQVETEDIISNLPWNNGDDEDDDD